MLRVTMLALLLSAASARAQSGPADLVKRLGSGSFAERERAAKELDRLGELALPALEEATRGSDLEAQRRATSLLRRIEERTLAMVLLKPTPTRFPVQGRHDPQRPARNRETDRPQAPLARRGMDAPQDHRRHRHAPLLASLGRVLQAGRCA